MSYGDFLLSVAVWSAGVSPAFGAAGTAALRQRQKEIALEELGVHGV